ncbi:MAG: hypothetical protein CL840_02945 [Crocinitomicaceae bacterium]|nr:hypothetical protein [Crocinitomicaceae bacterium]
MEINQVKISDHYLIAKQMDQVDYEDNFQLKTKALKNAPLTRDCMIAFFKSFSPMLIKLILIRESIARKLGLKTANKTTSEERNKALDEFEGNIGDSIAIFEVLDKNDTELLTGQSDKHLDFRLSFISYQQDDFNIVELATTVKFHNVLGKIYFFIVKPFHRYFMRRILMRMKSKLVQATSN